MRAVVALALLSAAIVACAPVPPPEPLVSGETVAQQLLRLAPVLHDARFSLLLNFETPDDALFVTAPPRSGSIVHDHAFTGHGSYLVDAQVPAFSIKLSSLLAGRPFPGTWTMIGGYLFSQQRMRVTAYLEGHATEGRQIDLTAGVWTAVFIDLPKKPLAAPTPALVFQLPASHGQVWCDDVMLIENSAVLTAPAPEANSAGVNSGAIVSGSAAGWRIERQGTQYIGVAGDFNFSLVAADVAANGWTCDEANPMRCRFHSGNGQTLGDQSGAGQPRRGRTLTIYSDGRAYWDGVYKPMSDHVKDRAYALANQTPARIEVADGSTGDGGRLDRNTPGDANNDGYNETTGSYRLIASGPRIELQFIPAAGVPDPRPVLEISGLPFGKVLATLEGRLIEQSQRTSDGHVLIELPATIDRPATVDVRIEN